MQKESLSKNLYLHFEDDSIELSKKAELLIIQQLQNWKLASDGYKSLSAVQKNIFEFDGFTIETHFNPGRIISSSAKVDSKSISERPCFLCGENLPEEQKAIHIIENFILLLNPFPIFNQHYTIPTIDHIPQAIKFQIKNMLLISSLVGKNYTLFYNGPRCGASAPDHMHFQSGSYGFMNIDNEYNDMVGKYGKILYEDGELVLKSVAGCLRNYISIESNNISKLVEEFNNIYYSLGNNNSVDEPMMNIICSYNNSWRLLIFPRSKHRPTYFYEEDEQRILISPAAVDFGGVLIFPREEDFSKITRELIVDIYKQVTIGDDEFNLVLEKLKNR